MTEINLTNVDNQRKVSLKVGDCINITLAENATTGYQWDILSFSDAAFEFIGVDRVAVPSGALGAGGGGPVFRFRAKDSGETSIILKLWRGFENDASVFKFSINASIQ